MWSGFATWHSGGPVHGEADFRERLDYISSHEALIVDRLPLISEVVYCRALGKPFPIPEAEILKLLLEEDPIVVYCRLDSVERMLERMLAGKPHKPPEYYASVRANYPAIVAQYDALISKLEHAGFTIILQNWEREKSTELSVRACAKAMLRRMR